MEKERKMQVATFRFGVICDLIGGARLGRGEKERLLGEKSARVWEIPGSGRTRISRTTIQDWIRRYERGGRRLEVLFPKDRLDRGAGPSTRKSPWRSRKCVGRCPRRPSVP